MCRARRPSNAASEWGWEGESVHLKGEGITKGKYRQIANGRGGKISHPEWCERNFINGRALAR